MTAPSTAWRLWTWDGTQLADATTAAFPVFTGGIGTATALLYDLGRGNLMLLGGSAVSGTDFLRVWEGALP